MLQYDSRYIVVFAERLYNQAARIVVLFVLLGIVLGLGGAVAADAAYFSGGAPSFMTWFGGSLGGLMGFALGNERAFHLRLSAQRALCQVRMEEHLRAIAAQTKAPGNAGDAAAREVSRP